jgi:hypothetical protein
MSATAFERSISQRNFSPFLLSVIALGFFKVSYHFKFYRILEVTFLRSIDASTCLHLLVPIHDNSDRLEWALLPLAYYTSVQLLLPGKDFLFECENVWRYHGVTLARAIK